MSSKTSAAHASVNADAVPQGTRRIEMAAVFCVGCHQPATLDADKLCSNCRNCPREAKKAGTAGAGDWRWRMDIGRSF